MPNHSEDDYYGLIVYNINSMMGSHLFFEFIFFYILKETEEPVFVCFCVCVGGRCCMKNKTKQKKRALFNVLMSLLWSLPTDCSGLMKRLPAKPHHLVSCLKKCPAPSSPSGHNYLPVQPNTQTLCLYFILIQNSLRYKHKGENGIIFYPIIFFFFFLEISS